MKDIISTNNKSFKGYRSQFCKSIGCQSSYLSQVLHRQPHFNLEQADKINHFLGHTKLESKYFITLVEMSRAGTKSLEMHFKEQLFELKKQSNYLKNQLKESSDIPEKAHHTYYSTWYYAAIHVILSIPGFNSPLKIANHLNLPLGIVNKVISFLTELGLVEKRSNSFHLTNKSFHLSNQSDFIQRHHINWRTQALLSSENNLDTDFHYSNVVAISEKDFKKIKEILFKTVENCRDVIRPSKEETLAVVTMDLFKL